MSANKERKRLALTANKIPEDIYLKLEKLGSDRKLTPYIVNLIEKEEQVDRLLEEVSEMKKILLHIDKKLDGKKSHIEDNTENKSNIDREDIVEGKLNISNNIIGGIEEDVEEVDF